VRVKATWNGALVVLAMVCGALVAGCESDAPGMVVSYVDSAGRSCSVDVIDISATASYDVDPSTLVTCEAGQEPAMVTHSDHDFETMITTLRSCGACVDRAMRTTYIGLGESCADVTCETDADCVYDRYACDGGVCRDLP